MCTFIPYCVYNIIELKNNLQQFSCKSHLLEFFCTENESEDKKSSDDSIMKNKPTLNLPRTRDKVLHQNINSLNGLNFPDLHKAPKSNFSKLKWPAINNLKNDKNMDIKEVNEGGSDDSLKIPL